MHVPDETAKALQLELNRAFAGELPIFHRLFHALLECLPYKESEILVKNLLHAGLVQCARRTWMNKTEYSAITARIKNVFVHSRANKHQYLAGIYDMVVAEKWELQMQHVVLYTRAASTIQVSWRQQITDPKRSLCVRRLLRELDEMNE